MSSFFRMIFGNEFSFAIFHRNIFARVVTQIRISPQGDNDSL